MVSLWGSQKDGNDDASPRVASPNGEPSNVRTSEADERTRLLVHHPPPTGHDGYLSPDDPAVSLAIPPTL